MDLLKSRFRKNVGKFAYKNYNEEGKLEGYFLEGNRNQFSISI